MNDKNEVAGDQTRTGAPQRGIGFALMVIYVSLVAAIAAVVTVTLSLKIWAMFIGWTCFGTSAGNVKRGFAAIACLLIGVALAMGSIVVLQAISPFTGAWALPIVIFGLAVIAMLSLLTPPLDSVPGYFLGMTAFYASQLEPGLPAYIQITSAALIGGVAGWLLVAGPQLIKRAQVESAENARPRP
jgi:hypothetical protein